MSADRQLNLFKSKRQRGVRMPPPLECYLHFSIADILGKWLSAGWQYNHIASGEYRTPATAARLKRLGVRPGWPDLILLSPEGRPFFLELKRRGGKLSKDQRVFADWCAAHSVTFRWFDSFDDTLNQLKEWGAIRTGIQVQ